MSAAASPSEPLQRARGLLRVGLARRDERTVLARLRQEGCLKARMPRPDPGGWTEIVTMNSSGGIAGGDVLDSAITLGPGARASLVTPAAERVYRAPPGSAAAALATTITLGAGGAVEWLPQETILFDGALLQRRLSVRMAADSSFLGAEQVIFGRTARGEQVRSGSFTDSVRIIRDARLVLHDAIRLGGAGGEPIAELLARPAVAAGAAALATLWFVAAEAEAAVGLLRAALDGAEAGVSAWDGMLVARILAPDGAALRRAVIAGLQALRGQRTLPRVWQC